MYKLAWGSKRVCQECETRFYDLGQSPATCPKCGTLFELFSGPRRKSSKKGALPLDIIDADISLDADDDITIDDDALLEDVDDNDSSLDILSDKDLLGDEDI